MNRQRINAMTWVFPELSCSTRVAMLAWHDGHCKRVESGPTAAVESAGKLFMSIRDKNSAITSYEAISFSHYHCGSYYNRAGSGVALISPSFSAFVLTLNDNSWLLHLEWWNTKKFVWSVMKHLLTVWTCVCDCCLGRVRSNELKRRETSSAGASEKEKLALRRKKWLRSPLSPFNETQLSSGIFQKTSSRLPAWHIDSPRKAR